MEYGLFNDEGLVEGQFYSQEEAIKARDERYTDDDDLEVLEICPDHPEYARLGCEECDRDDENEEEE